MKTSVTVGGVVVFAIVCEDGSTDSLIELKPEQAEIAGSDLLKAAKMARAAVEPTAPPGPEERP